MGRNIRHLLPEDLVVPVHHMVESMFPVHGNQRHTILVHKQESAVSIYSMMIKIMLIMRFPDIAGSAYNQYIHTLLSRLTDWINR